VPGARPPRRPALIATAVAAVLAISYLAAPLMGGDLSAQLARADFAGAHPLGLVDLRWFGGTLPFGYSLWVPQVMAWLGPRVVGAIAAVAATWITTRLLQRAGAARPTAGGVAAAICQASNLAEGRIAFAAGLAFGLAALLLLTDAVNTVNTANTANASEPRLRSRYALAAVAALLAGAANPVAALLLWLCAAVALIQRRIKAAAVLLIASAIPVVIISGVFADGGRQLFNPVDALRAALASVLVAVFVPRRHRAVRLGALLGLVMVVAAYLLPTAVGGNAIRLTLLFAVPVVAAFVDWRWWAAVLAVIATAVVQSPVTLGTLTGAGAPATRASYYTPLLNEIRAQGPLTGRVEVPELTGHWEAVYVARQLPLARGWLRQVDTELNGNVFYDHKPTAADYKSWLATNAVQYVAVPDARLTFYGKREASLIATTLPYLDDVWHDRNWTLYRVANPVPIVEAPGTLISENADSITFTAPAGKDVRLNVRWFRWLSVDPAGGSCITRDGDAVIFRAGPGATTRHVLSSSLHPDSHCT
jgi:hypothetical protein